MKKTAIFVEGDTEVAFVEQLVFELFGHQEARIIHAKSHGGTVQIQGERGADGDVAKYMFLITNCCCDEKVKSLILERAQLLANQGYAAILGLKDLYPDPIENLSRMEAGLSRGLDTIPIPVRIYVAVKEIEAWFLNEHCHYRNIDDRLQRNFIRTSVNFDPVDDCAEMIVKHPAGLLDRIYKLVGKSYDKRERDVKRVVSALDFGEIYGTVREKSNSLDQFISALESVFDSKQVLPR